MGVGGVLRYFLHFEQIYCSKACVSPKAAVHWLAVLLPSSSSLPGREVIRRTTTRSGRWRRQRAWKSLCNAAGNIMCKATSILPEGLGLRRRDLGKRSALKHMVTEEKITNEQHSKRCTLLEDHFGESKGACCAVCAGCSCQVAQSKCLWNCFEALEAG